MVFMARTTGESTSSGEPDHSGTRCVFVAELRHREI
jgi:hypothetical protein